MSGHTDERGTQIREALDYGGDYMPTQGVRDGAFAALNSLLAERDELRRHCDELLRQASGKQTERDLLAECAEVAERRVDTLEAALAEAERVLRVVSGWNTDRVSTADAIAPARAYVAARAVVPAPTGDDE